jgi:hypothetical protein
MKKLLAGASVAVAIAFVGPSGASASSSDGHAQRAAMQLPVVCIQLSMPPRLC